MSAKAPELEAKMSAILGQMKMIEDATHKATRLNESVAELDGQISRVSARVPFVEKLELRLNGLNAVSAEIDQKLQEQLARRAELETLKTACDGLASQMVDAQHKLEAVRALQTRLLPLIAELNTLKSDIGTASERLTSIKYNKGDHLRAAEALRRAGRRQPARSPRRSPNAPGRCKVFGGARTLHGDQGRTGRRARSRPEPAAGIRRARSRRRRISYRAPTRCSSCSEQRRAQVTFGEKKLAGVETRLGEIKQLAEALERNVQSIAGREQLVNAVKAEVEQVSPDQRAKQGGSRPCHRAPRRCRGLRGQVDLLLSRIAETDERIGSIDARREKMVDEVQTKANAIAHLLEDVRINLETLGEQKAVVDHVAEKVGPARVHAAGVAQHAADAAARARARGAHRGQHQAAARQDGVTSGGRRRLRPSPRVRPS